MKKLLSLLLALLMLLGCALAESLTPANTPITIDGVRAAFFDNQGNYLSLYSLNGLVYAPFEAFCQSAGVNATANGKVISLNGVPLGLFDAAGNYLAPQEVEGVLYVPLSAFANAVGLGVVEDDNGFAITRMGHAVPAETPQPEPAAPETGKAAITAENFGKYFAYTITTRDFDSVTTRYTIGTKLAYSVESQVTYDLNCTARSAFGIEDVRFSITGSPTEYELGATGLGGVTFKGNMPISGSLTMSQQETGSALLGYNPGLRSVNVRTTTVFDASGCVILPYEEAQKANEATWNKAQSYLKTGETNLDMSAFYDAEELLAALAKVDYPGASEALRAAQEKRAQINDTKKQAQYEKALAALANGDYEAAQSGFSALAGVGYKDSAAKLTEVEQKQEEARLAQEEAEKKTAYDAAAKLEADGDYTAAYDAFIALGEYGDSAQRAEKLMTAKTYAEAEALMAEYEYHGALALLEPLAHEEKAQELIRLCNFRTMNTLYAFNSDGTAWFAAEDGAMKAGLVDFKGNILKPAGTFEQTLGLQLGKSHIEANFIADGYYRTRTDGDLCGYVDTQGEWVLAPQYTRADPFRQGKALVEKDGKTCIIDTVGEVLAELPQKKNRSYVIYLGEDLVSYKEGDKIGVMNLQGKVVVKPKYTNAIGWFQEGLSMVSNRKGSTTTYAIMNTKGKEVLAMKKVTQPVILTGEMIATRGKDGFGIINLKGKELLPKKYENIRRQGDLILAKKNGQWGAFDLELNQVIPFQWEDIGVGYQSQVAACKRGGRYYLYEVGGDNKLLTPNGCSNLAITPDSPYIACYDSYAGWFVRDSQGNLVY